MDETCTLGGISQHQQVLKEVSPQGSSENCEVREKTETPLGVGFENRGHLH